jgi:hypothetical protein
MTEKEKVRPQLLMLLCILTFIGSGSSFIANMTMFLTVEDWRLAFEKGMIDNLNALFREDALAAILTVSPRFYLIQSIIYLASLSGALLMWKLMKIGFHIYTVAQILLLISYNVFLSSQPFPVFPLLLSVTFILLYSRNFSSMH